MGCMGLALAFVGLGYSGLGGRMVLAYGSAVYSLISC